MAAMSRFLFGSLCAVALLSPTVRATTWIVDAAGGGNFSDIQTAILASAPGDVLLVQPGTYAPFALDRGLTIIGYGACGISGTLSISGLPAGQTCAVVRIESATLDIQGCAGHVIVQDLQQPTRIQVQNSPDVRFASVLMPVHSSTTPLSGLSLSNSRLELVHSSVRGADGQDCTANYLDGAVGLAATNSRVHSARSGIHGGNGSHCDQVNYYCGGGQEGLVLDTASQGILCGESGDPVESGYGPLNLYYGDCSHDGWSACGISIRNASSLRISGVTAFGHPWSAGFQCIYFAGCDIGTPGGTLVQPPLVDPTLTVTGNPAGGSSVQFAIDGPSGAVAVLSFGRGAIVQVDPNTVIEKLTQALRSVNLGALPASGTVSFTLPLSSTLHPGAKLFAQAAVTLPGGEVRRTNSVPIIVR